MLSAGTAPLCGGKARQHTSRRRHGNALSRLGDAHPGTALRWQGVDLLRHGKTRHGSARARQHQEDGMTSILLIAAIVAIISGGAAVVAYATCVVSGQTNQELD
jgi:hypothetical protein